MKVNFTHFFVFVLAWMSGILAYAENPLKLTYKIGEGAAVTTEESTAGELSVLLGGHGQAMTVTELVVEGYLNADDVRELRLMAGSNENDESTADGALKVVDLAKTHFVAMGSQEQRESATNPNNFLTTQSNAVVATGDALPGWMFSHCSRLEKVTLPSGLSYVSQFAFCQCVGLKECTDLVGDNTTMTEIGDHAFDGCSSLSLSEGGKLPQKLETIGTSAFQKTAITALVIPEKTTTIGVSAFIGCGSLENLTFAGDIASTSPSLNILENAFEFCNKMNLTHENGQLPNRIVNIANRAFKDTGITQLVLPANELLTGVEAEGIGNVGYAAFQNCYKLETVTIPSNFTTFNGVVFNNCTHLSTLQFLKPDNIVKIDEHAFCNTPQLRNQFAGKLTNVETIGAGAFQDCPGITDDDVATLLAKVTRIEANTFWNCAGITKVNIPASVAYIGKSAFGVDTNLKEVTVNRGSQIEAVWYEGTDNIFNLIEPNQVQVKFVGEAEANYQNYRNDIVKDGNNLGKNAFMYLLTKTLDENNASYSVVAQLHADVQLHRIFKAGWNTLVLPFGATPNNAGSDEKCARIYQKALNPTGNENFMIAAYRGLRKNEDKPDESNFYFLKYANYDTDPLDDFEPILVRMTQEDIDASQGVYTFKDVQLNYDSADGWQKAYTPAEAQARMGKKVSKTTDGEQQESYFNGAYDHDMNDKFGKCSYDDFYFTGTLQLQQGEATEDASFIAPGDYIIQNNTFIKCQAGMKYGMKGFRGYFKQLPASTYAAKANIGISVVDDMGQTTAIDCLDGDALGGEGLQGDAEKSYIYNLNGQMVGKDASLLGKGIYVKNGKKFIVK